MLHAFAAPQEVYSAEEIATAARVPVARVRALLGAGHVIAYRHFVSKQEAVQLVRTLSTSDDLPEGVRSPLTIPGESKRRGGLSLAASGLLHGVMLVALLLAISLGLLSANDTDQVIKDDQPAHLVFLMSPGPGGGGGGGGLKMPAPAPKIERKVVTPKKIKSPIPPVRRPPPPPR